MYKFLLVSLLLFSTYLLCAQQQAQQEVASAVDKLSNALLALTDPLLSYGHSGGKIENREQFVSALGRGTADFKTLELTDQQIMISGKTAVVRHKLTADITDNGKDLSVKLAVMLVWTKSRGKWILLARQAIKI